MACSSAGSEATARTMRDWKSVGLLILLHPTDRPGHELVAHIRDAGYNHRARQPTLDNRGKHRRPDAEPPRSALPSTIGRAVSRCLLFRPHWHLLDAWPLVRCRPP